ncbi:hypothetical protein DFH09DRAFT_917155 [Mycena vulgaris]|nr:hypothetical protein DFH09DRAFT_942857 [Mycena vulgaris]KAJ6570457.1 hypothetical protein DFH09DRAFT_917155 [Mycena vulgaris]
MTKGLQCKLWESLLCITNEFIPVMLCSKNTTEMCITTGQEGAVVGWDEGIGPIDQRILDTLFVKLINLPLICRGIFK